MAEARMFGKWGSPKIEDVLQAGRRRRLLTGTLGLVAVAWLFPIRLGVIVGSSMDPTLRSGQLVAVDRDFYRHNPPAVGDVVLFRGPHGVYVKRIHAVAGQTVHLLEEGGSQDPVRFPIARGSERRIAARWASSGVARVRQVAVPEGTFFALGDALHNSEDSRDFGPVATERILGRVLPIGASLAAPDVEMDAPGPVRITRQMVASRAL